MRKVNEDNYKCLSIWGGEGVLLVVCDGMGGHRAGEIASKRAIEEFSDKIVSSPCLAEDEDDCLDEIRRTMIIAAKEANEMLFHLSSDMAEFSGMGTTLVAGIIFRNKLYCVNIGDSRLYIIRRTGAEQITHDHSFVQYLVDFGKLSAEEAKNYPRKNVITQAVGINENPSADFFCVNLKNRGNGFILLCSDGLSNYVDENVMLDILYGSPQKTEDEINLTEATEQLIEYANTKGGADNITAVLAQF